MVMAALALFVAAGVASAQHPEGNRPGSLLIYPLIQKTANEDTVVCFTNTNTDFRVVPGTFPPNEIRRGDVAVVWNILWALDTDPRWQKEDGKENLSPGDTFSLLVSSLGSLPVGARGFMYAYAVSPDNNIDPIDFDFLTGEAIIVGIQPQNYLFSMPAIPFKSEANKDRNQRETIQGWRVTDGAGSNNNPDGLLTFNGVEYYQFPAILYQPMYLDQGTVPGVLNDEIVFLLGRADGADIRTTVAGNVWDNRENPGSYFYDFDCWTRTRIFNLNPHVIFQNPQRNNGPDELFTGWIDARGAFGVNRVTSVPTDNVPILGAFVHRADVGAVGFTAGTLLWWDGERSGAFLAR